MKRTVSHLLTAIGTAAVLLLCVLPATARGPARTATSGAQELGDPDYGVCRGTSPRCYHAWGNFDPAADGYKILVYSRTAGPRHANLGPALGTGMNPALSDANVAQKALVTMGAEHGFGV